MNFDEIEKIISEQINMPTCAVCGLPFKPRSKRQKLCGDPDCRKEYLRLKAEKQREVMKDENPEMYRKYRRDAMRRYRGKKREIERIEENYEKVIDATERQMASNRKLSEWGINYGKKQAEETLASVPKINTDIGGKKE